MSPIKEFLGTNQPPSGEPNYACIFKVNKIWIGVVNVECWMLKCWNVETLEGPKHETWEGHGWNPEILKHENLRVKLEIWNMKWIMNEFRIMNYELWSMNDGWMNKVWMNYEMNYEVWNELWIMNYELWIMNDEMNYDLWMRKWIRKWIMNYELCNMHDEVWVCELGNCEMN